LAVEEARRMLGPAPFIGLSIRTVEQAAAAPLALLDYVGIGGVYSTMSKTSGKFPDRPRRLRKVSRSLRGSHRQLPTCGIAGITAANAEPVIAAVADGVSVISALSHRPDPQAAARRAARSRRYGAQKHTPRRCRPSGRTSRLGSTP